MPCENFKKITPLSCFEPNKLTTPGNFPSLETTKYLNTMKTTRKHLPFYLFLLVWAWESSSLVQAQSQSDTTYTGSITVTTQAQVNALNTTLAGKTSIDGSVIIGGSDITDLAPLGSIVRITGNFYAGYNDLTDLGDFPALQSIGGYFSVSGNRELTDLGDFPALQSIGGHFSVEYNRELTDVGDFSSLQSIGGDFSVVSNSKLTDLGDFPALDSIGRTFSVRSNNDLTDVGDFSSLQSIWGTFSVSSNNELTDLGYFSSLQSIGGDFSVVSNSKLTDLGDFPALDSIGRTFSVRSNNDLTDVGDFSSLQSIWGTFSVSSNNELTDLGDFPALQSIGGIFRVSSNNELTDLGDFPALDSIGRTFSVSSNNELTDLGDFSVLQSIGGYFYVSGNDTLTDVGDFPFLQSIGGYFSVRSNNELTDLGDFPVLDSIGGYFSVSSNDQLLTLGDFSSLTSVGIGRVYVPSLGESRDSVNIVVEFNNKLLLCSWLEEFLPTGTHAVTGDIYIQGNATGCATTEEIKNPPPVLLVAKDRLFVHKDSTTTSFTIYANVRWQLATSDDSTWMISLSSDSSTHTSRITGENKSTITLTHTRAPDETPRSTTLMLTAIDEEGNELTNPASITIHFTQLSTFYEGDIILISQAEVDEFISNTTVIDGNLTIGYTDSSLYSRSDITDLTPLSNINQITGYVWIRQNGQLDNLNALNNLQTIGGDFQILRNKLTDLGDFPVLQSIGGDFSVRYNLELTDLGDFPALQTIGGDFNLQTIEGGGYVMSNRAYNNNYNLTDLGDFPVLQSIGGDFYVMSNHSYNNNRELTDLGDFPVLQSIGGDFSVRYNRELTDLGDFPALQTIGGDFNVLGAGKLADLGDFPALDSIGGSFRVSNNYNLTDLGDFPALDSIGGNFYVYHNYNLTDLGDFPVLTSIGIRSAYVPSLGRSTSNVSIVVERNPNLSTCCILTEFLPGGTHAVSGGILISDNATGCNSESEINATTLTLTSSNESITHNDTDPIAIDFIVGCGATGWTSAITYTPANADFITLSPTGGTNQTGAVTLHATPTENMNVERTATIRLSITGGTASQTVVITQAELPHTLSVSSTPSSTNGRINVSSLSTTVSISVDPGGRATGWTSTNTGSSFISLNSTRSTSTSATIVTARISGNLSTSSRSGTITFRSTGSGTSISRTITIMQSNPPHTLSVSSTPSSTNGRININSSSTTVSISVDPGGGATGWRISRNTGSRFMYLSRSSSSSTSATIVTATISGNLSTSSRSGTITFRSTGSGSSISKTITIMQRAAPPTLVISTSDQTINHNAGDFTITFDLGGGAIGWESSITGAGFITLDPSMNTTSTQETVTITATPGLNDGLERKDTIIFTTTGGVADTVVITQRAAPPTLSLTSNSADTIAYNSTDDIDIMFNVGGGATGWTSKITYTPVDANFITRSSSEGTDQTGAVTITATPEVNTGIDERTATITLTTTGIGTPATQMIVIRQESKTLMVTTNKNHQIAYDNIDPISISFTVGGSATGWTSEITYTPVDANFITRSSSEGTDQRGAVTITATPTVNTGVERTATITLTTTGIGTPATQMIVIRQGEANITISRETLIVTTNKNHQIAYDNIDPIPITFTVGGSATGWTSAITYAPANADFITFSPTRGTDITGAVTITATPKVNTGVERTATITLTTTGIGTPATQMIVIRQGEANITISRETLIVTTNKNHQIAYDNIDPIPITFTIGGGATGWTSAITYAPANANFIALSPTRGTDQTGAITLMATPTVNTGVERTATITLTTTGIIGTVPVVQTIVIGQEANPTTLSTHTKEPFFTLYPNPTEGKLTIKGVTGYLQMYIYDLVGREVMTYSLTPSKKTIDVSDLPLGMYVVTLRGEEQTWTEVLIIVN